MLITLVQAFPDHAQSVELDLPAGSRVIDAYQACGLQGEEGQRFAIYGKEVEAERVLREGERIDLLRPLRLDPKISRRQRVEAARLRRLRASS